ncbi:protein kinase domain-containing protein [Frigoriglobus tundricola]|uniref:Protein kinase domain-containing protein n=1 Tax=Frigoriglobus tundricola TaxID=2774151 RepID=A0A6M5Z1S2_9BACT|nr:protein kinase [Frigoriglobus tundricola]QJX00109.1 hypothetical protein FTUN_7733 [Frigoriglobus tundricola]
MPDNESGPPTEFALPPSPARSPKAKPVPPTVAAPQPPTVAHPLIPLLRPGDVSADLHPHWVIPGYTIEAEIARGGMGVVYRARELALDRDVAIKLLRDRFSADSAAARRFLDEARITGQLQHPAIPPVHHIGTLPDGRPFLAMKLIKGDTLADLLDRTPNDPARFVPAFGQVCQAVAYAHARKVVHRDLKPANVMIGAFGEVQVMDWGLAKILSGAPPEPLPETGGGEGPVVPAPAPAGVPDDALATQEGSILGTPAYISPEQASGAIDQVDERADVFGLGAVLCAILTGDAPYASPDPETVRALAINGETGDAFRRLDAGGADPELVALCKRCLARDRAARPRDAGEVARAVTAHLLAAETRAKQAELQRVRSEAERAAAEVEAAERPQARRVQYALAGALASAFVLAAFGAGLAALWQTAKRSQKEAESARDELHTETREAVRQKDLADRARVEAVQLQGAAAAARDEALHQKGAAENALAREAEALKKLKVHQYGRIAEVAYDQWHDDNVASARKLLGATPEDLRGWEWHHLNRLCSASLVTARGHTGELTSAALSADGARIVTGSYDGTMRVWDAATGKELLKREVCDKRPVSAAFRPDGLRIVTAGADKLAKVWDAVTGQELLKLEGHTDGVTAAAFRADGARIVTGSWDGTARVWDANTGKDLFKLEGHSGAVLSVAFQDDGSRIVTGSRDGTARVWDANTGKERLVVPPNETAVGRAPSAPGAVLAALSPDGTRIVTATPDGTARVWDAGTGKERLVLRGHTNGVRSAGFSPDGARIVTGSADQTAKVWDARTGRELFALKGHTDPVNAVSFSADGLRIVTGSEDHTAKVWDARTGADALVLAPHETATGALVYRSGHSSSVTAAAFSRDGTQVLTASLDRSVKLWDARTGAEVLTFRGDKYGVLTAALSPDGHTLATGSREGARTRDARTGKELHALTGHTGEVTSVSFRPDGARILTTGRDKTARVWDARTGAELLKLEGHTGWVISGAFCGDGSRIVTGSEDKTAKVWDAGTGKELLKLDGHTGWVISAMFSADGSRIVTGGEDGTARMWDATSGKELLKLEGHTNWVSGAAFAPDGSRIVTGSHDKTVKIWDAKTGAELLSLKGHTDQVSSVAFSQDGLRIVTGSRDKTARVWDARPVAATFVGPVAAPQ